MNEGHSDLTGLVIVVMGALACGIFMTRFRQPAIVGYILAGVILGPSGLKLVQDRGNVEMLAELGVPLPVKPLRGQIVLLKGPPQRLRHVVWCGSRYLVPRDDGRILVGSTQEDVGFAPTSTAQGVQELLDFALRLAPELGSFEVERAWAGLRPASPDGLPFLGLVPGFDNLYLATGHSTAGFELSAGSALVLAQLLCGETPAVSLDAFRLDR